MSDYLKLAYTLVYVPLDPKDRRKNPLLMDNMDLLDLKHFLEWQFLKRGVDVHSGCAFDLRIHQDQMILFDVREQWKDFTFPKTIDWVMKRAEYIPLELNNKFHKFVTN